MKDFISGERAAKSGVCCRPAGPLPAAASRQSWVSRDKRRRTGDRHLGSSCWSPPSDAGGSGRRARGRTGRRPAEIGRCAPAESRKALKRNAVSCVATAHGHHAAHKSLFSRNPSGHANTWAIRRGCETRGGRKLETGDTHAAECVSLFNAVSACLISSRRYTCFHRRVGGMF